MIRQLEYHSGISEEEAKQRLSEVREEFERVKQCYPRSSIFRKNILQEDKQILADCFGVLLPLGSETAVQEQLKVVEDYSNTLHYSIAQLSMEILNYLADFRNSGVKRIR